MIRMCFCLIKIRLINSKSIIALLLGSIPLSVDAVKLVALSKFIGQPLNILDGIIYSTSNLSSMLLASLGAVIALLGCPPGEIKVVYDVFRISRKKWMFLELGSLTITSIIYYLVIFAINMLIIMPYSFFGNIWSDVMYTSGYSNPDLGANLYGLWFNCPQIMLHTTPLQASTIGFITSTMYILLLAIILFFMNMNFDKPFGIFLIFLIHVSGYLLNFRYARESWGHLSLLGNSLLTELYFTKPYYSINFITILLMIMFVFVLVIYKSLRRYDFKITTGAQS